MGFQRASRRGIFSSGEREQLFLRGGGELLGCCSWNRFSFTEGPY